MTEDELAAYNEAKYRAQVEMIRARMAPEYRVAPPVFTEVHDSRWDLALIGLMRAGRVLAFVVAALIALLIVNLILP